MRSSRCEQQKGRLVAGQPMKGTALIGACKIVFQNGRLTRTRSCVYAIYLALLETWLRGFFGNLLRASATTKN